MNAIPPPMASAPSSNGINESTPLVLNSLQKNELIAQGFSEGLLKSLVQTFQEIPLRIWIIDNSGSMLKADGHRIISSSSNDVRIVNTTRWDEIKETVEYHIQLSALLQAPTSFRLLNHPGASVGSKQFDIGQMGPEMIPSEVSKAMSIMRKTKPSGVTPLTERLNEVYEDLVGLKESLEMEGRRVAIVLATDGMPTDSRGMSDAYSKQCFVASLRRLEELPVWLVIRLCTDDDEVVDYYNSLDEELELSMDVLDDYIGEAQECYQHNKWLNYTLPLHRLREMGHHDRIFDLLDEKKLSKTEVSDFCRLLFGSDSFDGAPDPELDWIGFLSQIERSQIDVQPYWHPIKKKPKPFIDVKKLKNTSKCSIS